MHFFLKLYAAGFLFFMHKKDKKAFLLNATQNEKGDLKDKKTVLVLQKKQSFSAYQII